MASCPEQMIEHCDNCSTTLELGQIGLCDDCQADDHVRVFSTTSRIVVIPGTSTSSILAALEDFLVRIDLDVHDMYDEEENDSVVPFFDGKSTLKLDGNSLTFKFHFNLGSTVTPDEDTERLLHHLMQSLRPIMDIQKPACGTVTASVIH